MDFQTFMSTGKKTPPPFPNIFFSENKSQSPSPRFMQSKSPMRFHSNTKTQIPQFSPDLEKKAQQKEINVSEKRDVLLSSWVNKSQSSGSLRKSLKAHDSSRRSKTPNVNSPENMKNSHKSSPKTDHEWFFATIKSSNEGKFREMLSENQNEAPFQVPCFTSLVESFATLKSSQVEPKLLYLGEISAEFSEIEKAGNYQRWKAAFLERDKRLFLKNLANHTEKSLLMSNVLEAKIVEKSVEIIDLHFLNDSVNESFENLHLHLVIINENKQFFNFFENKLKEFGKELINEPKPAKPELDEKESNPIQFKTVSQAQLDQFGDSQCVAPSSPSKSLGNSSSDEEKAYANRKKKKKANFSKFSPSYHHEASLQEESKDTEKLKEPPKIIFLGQYDNTEPAKSQENEELPYEKPLKNQESHLKNHEHAIKAVPEFRPAFPLQKQLAVNYLDQSPVQKGKPKEPGHKIAPHEILSFENKGRGKEATGKTNATKEERRKIKDLFLSSIRTLMRGFTFKKYGLGYPWIQPQIKKLVFSSNMESFVFWGKKSWPKAKKLFITRDVLGVKEGRASKNFERFKEGREEAEEKSFSILMKERTVDLEARNEKEKEEFVRALRTFLGICEKYAK